MAAESQPDPDQAWKALSLVNDWVRHADTKIVATLAAAGVSGGLLYNLVNGWPGPSIPGVVLAYASGFALIWTGWGCAMGLVPRRTAAGADDRGLYDLLANGWETVKGWFSRDKRTETSPATEPPSDANRPLADTEEIRPPDDLVNLLFYSDIVKHYGAAGPEYHEVLATLTSDRRGMTKHIAQQIWANASVAERKYTWGKRAIIRLLISWFLLAAVAYVRVVWG